MLHNSALSIDALFCNSIMAKNITDCDIRIFNSTLVGVALHLSGSEIVVSESKFDLVAQFIFRSSRIDIIRCVFAHVSSNLIGTSVYINTSFF